MSPASSRRAFLSASAVALAAAATHGQGGNKPAPVILPRPVALGLDNFAVRASNLKAAQLIEYAASVGVDSLFISDLEPFESLEEAPLRALREEAASRNITLHVGTWSVCPTSKAFRPANGTAEEQLSRVIRVARALGVLGRQLRPVEDQVGLDVGAEQS